MSGTGPTTASGPLLVPIGIKAPKNKGGRPRQLTAPSRRDEPLEHTCVRFYESDMAALRAEAARRGVGYHPLIRKIISEWLEANRGS